jgi:hypothetical protein
VVLRSRLFLGLAGGLLLVVIAGAAALAYLAQEPTPQVVSMPDSERAIPDLATLVRESDLIVVGRVAGDGTSRLPVQPGQSPGASAVLGGLPVTDYPFDVERVARGAAVSAGARITLIQPGGTVKVPIFPGGPSRSRVVQFEDDTLMARGDRYVLFLKRAEDSAFSVVGGAQGRLVIDAQNRVHPLHAGIPPTHAHDGQTLDGFLADVAAIH